MSVRLNLLEAYLKEDPHDEFLKYALALEYKSLGKNQEAYGALISLIQTSPQYLPAYYMTAKTAEELGMTTEAIDFYKKGIERAIEQKENHTLGELKAALNLLTEE